MAHPLDDALREAVLNRLDLLDQVAERADAGTLLPLARLEISRLADGWRLLLTVHQPDEGGRCQACPRRVRGERWPCQVWRLAHEHLIGDGVPRGQRRRLPRVQREHAANRFRLVGVVAMLLRIFRPSRGGADRRRTGKRRLRS